MGKHKCTRVFSTIQQRFVITYSYGLTVVELMPFVPFQVVLKNIQLTAIGEDINLSKRVRIDFLT